MILIYVCQKRNRKIHEYPWISVKSYPIGSMYAIYGNIYHQYTPNVSIYIYTSTMDPMGIASENIWFYHMLSYMDGFSPFSRSGDRKFADVGDRAMRQILQVQLEKKICCRVFFGPILWCCLMIYGNLWWFDDDLWLFVMVRWWFMAIYDGSMMIHDCLWWFEDDLYDCLWWFFAYEHFTQRCWLR